MRCRHATARILSFMLKIDIHTHILSQAGPDLEERYGYDALEWLALGREDYE